MFQMTNMLESQLSRARKKTKILLINFPVGYLKSPKLVLTDHPHLQLIPAVVWIDYMNFGSLCNVVFPKVPSINYEFENS